MQMQAEGFFQEKKTHLGRSTYYGLLETEKVPINFIVELYVHGCSANQFNLDVLDIQN
jgi:hypothetical protein